MTAHEVTLLIVDDDPFALEFQAHTASQALPGCTVVKTSEPHSVSDLCDRRTFDCVILDYDMPEMDGLTLADQLHARHPYLPIILCTGAGDELLAARAIQGDVTDYIPKSAIKPPSFRRTILRAIEIAKNARIIDQQRTELEGFAFALAHDFKQPLRQISTFSNLAIQDLEAGRVEDVRQHLAFLTGSARRLGALVDMMSEYTLLNKPITPETFGVRSVVDGIIDSLKLYIEERGGTLSVEGDAEVRGSAVFLHQVLQNLVVNGLKYNESPTPEVVLKIGSQDGCCVIEVIDNGIGIAPEYLEQVFQPLARLHSSAEYSGTGLGLTMARKAAAAQGGSVVCSSVLGVGSRFVVSLPLAQPAPAAAA